ncbi:MAG: hypothetical protein ACUZ8N_04015 [Candidatus Scalindua sp.]
MSDSIHRFTQIKGKKNSHRRDAPRTKDAEDKKNAKERVEIEY